VLVLLMVAVMVAVAVAVAVMVMVLVPLHGRWQWAVSQLTMLVASGVPGPELVARPATVQAPRARWGATSTATRPSGTT
jgi:membrane protein YdbS with pleckstrin-like domain